LRTLESGGKSEAQISGASATPTAGNLTHRIIEVVAEAPNVSNGGARYSHYNDARIAVANAIAAVEAGCTMSKAA